MRRDKEVRLGQEAGFSAEPTRIDMQSSPRSLDETARQTSAGRRIVGVLASGLGRRSSSHYSPTGSPNSPSLLVKRQFAFPILAVLAVAALGLWLLLPGGALRAQETGTFEYAENGTDPVATFTASDPEGVTPIVWSKLEAIGDPAEEIDGDALGDLDIADFASFEISSAGVLTFMSPPDFESPADTNANDAANTYKVVVQASDGATMNTLSWFKVTVNVTDVEEEGSIKLYPMVQETVTLLQPQVGVLITAHSLTDPDGNTADARTTAAITTDIAYKWYRTSSRTSMGTAIAGATLVTYTPKDTAGNSDVGVYLRVVATYTDGRADGDKTATAVSQYMTIDDIADNTAPEFSAASTTRSVLEELPKGTLVGRPVTATDADSGEKLTYWLSEVGDYAKFDIDPMTGQLKLDTKLDYESDPGDNQCTAANACEVTVSASDSSGDSTADGTDTIMVTITVVAVDEKPTFSDGAMTIEHVEGVPVLDTDLSNGETADPANYTATDPEESGVTFTLSGDDADKFKLNDPDGDGVVAAPMVRKVLEFKAKPDFEMPGDKNKDNVYQVTVVASDGLSSGMRDVTVKVTNKEELGKLTVMPAQPRVGTLLTAELTDSDGVISGTSTWEWRKQTVQDVGNECTTFEEDSWEPAGDPDAFLIKDAKSATYAPVAADAAEGGACLRVKVSYLDGFYDVMGPDAADDTATMFAKSVAMELTGKVQQAAENTEPKFASTRMMRYVPEDAMVPEDEMEGADVGAPVKAKDADALTYTLSGADAGSFDIVLNDGQIMVGAKAKLDHEGKPTHTVTVTATDPHGATDTTTVTIMVTDVDEAPKVSDKEDSTVTSMKTISYAEKGTGPVMTLTASDPEGVTPIVWSKLEAIGDPAEEIDGDALGDLDIADFASFEISSAGVLTFMSPPDFESPADTNANDAANTYKVVVQASDGATMNTLSWFKVTVTVTDVEEEGSIKLRPSQTGQEAVTLLQPQVGVEITAHSLTDPDTDNITSPTYKWYRTSSRTSMGTAIVDEDEAEVTTLTYIPQATSGNSDVGKYLRVVATYTDGRPGGDKTATAVSQYTTITSIDANTAPEFPALSAARSVPEESLKGTSVGRPVTATDADSGEKLTYWLSEDNEGSFTIDAVSGQIMVGVPLDIDADNAEATYTVTVSASDSSSDSADVDPAGTDTIMVTITVVAVDEKPTFSDGAMTIEHVEGVPVLDTDLSNGETADPANYTATDPEGGSVTFTLSGDDAGKFKLNDPDGDGVVAAPMVRKVLEFKAKPDFEMPGDKNKDNVYQVTVVASDGLNSGMRDVTVKVTNKEELGKLTVMPAQPRVGTLLTAELTDSDGVISGTTTWEWRKLEECPADGAEEDSWEPAGDPDTTLIKDAKSATYTPVAADNDDCLRVEVSYLDGFYDVEDDDSGDDTATMFAKSVPMLLTGKVQQAAENTSPKFASARMTRYVPEDANVPDAGANPAVEAADVGAPVKAKDTEDVAVLTYTLGGADAGSFDIGLTTAGQITVGAKAKLDHESKPTLTVTVTATDPHGATDTTTVTIHVTDVDEAPMIMASTGGLAISGPDRVSRDEGSTGTVATYTAEGATLALSGDDADEFTFRNGVLAFKSAPDYETKSTYRVTVTANDGTYTATRNVVVTVTDVAEDVPVIGGTLLTTYDVDPKNGKIDRDEVLNGIDDFFTAPIGSVLTREEVLDLIDLFFEGLGS